MPFSLMLLQMTDAISVPPSPASLAASKQLFTASLVRLIEAISRGKEAVDGCFDAAKQTDDSGTETVSV
jgi:hypothetical protein